MRPIWHVANEKWKSEHPDEYAEILLAEIDRRGDLLFKVADCDPERDRPDCWEAGDCQNCPFWASNHCDVDGWEPPK